jgi:hypothetical protein
LASRSGAAGVLSQVNHLARLRIRCQVGNAYLAESLAAQKRKRKAPLMKPLAAH